MLEGVEHQLRSSGKAEQPTVPRNLTIEHLMPVGWKKEDWPLPKMSIRMQRPTNAIRSSTQLATSRSRPRKLNSSMSNDPWNNKRDELQEHSVLLLNNELLTRPTWDEEPIRSRSDEWRNLCQQDGQVQPQTSGARSNREQTPERTA